MLLIGILKRYWGTYVKKLTQEIIQEIKNAEVPCGDPDIYYPLKAAYFSTVNLTSIVERSYTSDYFDLFLDIGHASEPIETAAGWEFLTKFDVGVKPDLRFFKDILIKLTEEASGTQLQTGLFYVYEQLSEEFRLENRDSIQENARVKYLFRDILGLKDANCMTYVTELESLRRLTTSRQPSFDEICEIYAKIANIANTDDDREFVSKAFEERNLIYIPSEQVWVPPTSCVWTGSAKVGRRYGISTLYGELQSFLVERLCVQMPTVATYVEQLLLVAAEVPPRMSEIKKAISAINDLNPTRASLEMMKQIKYLPVRTVQGTIELKRPSEEFFIGDRREYTSVFQGKVDILDFSLEEVHDIHPFLEALELGDRYMSVAVQETTRVQEPSDNESRTLSQNFRAKSKAFFRCALHYRSVKVHNSGQEIYHAFQNALIYKSEGFTKTLSLPYRGITVTAASDRGVFHLEDTEEALRLFVPRDNKQREKCYLTQLPKALMSYLFIDEPRAEKTFLLVIQASVYVLDEVLDEGGIVQVPDGYLSSSEQDNVSIEEDSHSEIAVDSLDNFPTPGTDASIPRSTRLSALGHASGHEVFSTTSYSRASSPYVGVERVDRPRVSEPSSSSDLVLISETATDAQTSSTQLSHYVRFLTRIIQIARRTELPTILARSVRPMGNVQTFPDYALREELAAAFGTRSENQLAHDIKLGAAGELFVFELLLQFGLPGFNRQNWKSRIRKEVQVHPEYHDLTPWSREEISDISYIDSESVLTDLLIENGYLSANQWRGKTPEYLIEVKSTTGVCDKAFYMSKSQYRRMRSHRLDAESPVAESTIYVIFRVFDLGKDPTNLRIYIDPESLRVQGRLLFAPESYNVVPGIQ
ncbi:Cadherin-89D [Talaromyces islandicus]|uniref:Cadherin-89D n=1 Tax=Talaromyces islandicus TaxID=28573 RepID=A0A0U1LZA6_TALIS|nr:Cadherin-89D [Talaromyces islandicus]